jgi:antitoxin CptB
MVLDEKSYKSKIKWRCHRGMLELDIILMDFFNQAFNSLSQEKKAVFELLLKESDPDIYAWVMGFKPVNKEEFIDIVAIIQSHH